ncbi:CD276 antigen homolog [Eleutherodactylus coqui]|uniref:CD276 antigen homolog n=1 Tax=Eleutherodactylus coqui TaxID=57060 RepID=UPI003462CAFB
MVYTQTTDRRFSLGIAVIFFSLLHTGADTLEIRRIDSPVEALLGHNVIIPCHFTGYKASHLDLSTVSVRWTLRTLEEELIYLFNGGQRVQNRSGSDIPERGLVEGDAGLHIPNLQIRDEGEYTCSVIVTPDKATSKVTLQLSGKPTCRVSDSSLVMNPGTERSVTCYVSGFYPAGAGIHWVRHSKESSNSSDLDENTCSKTPVPNPDGTYDVRSVLSVTALSIAEDGDVYSCVVGHRSLTGALTCNATLSVQPVAEDVTYIIGIISGILVALISAVLVVSYGMCYKKVPPEVSEIIECELIHTRGTKLACPIMNFRPKNIHITLYLSKGTKTINKYNKVDEWSPGRKENNDTPLLQPSHLKLEPFIPPPKNRLFSCFCAVTITPCLHEHNGAKLILEVQHEALKKPVSKKLMLRVQAAPVLDPTRTGTA